MDTAPLTSHSAPSGTSRRTYAFAGFSSVAIAAALTFSLTFTGENKRSSEEILSSALADGWVPAELQPPLGRQIFQWDPDIAGDQPNLLGPVIGLRVPYRGRFLTQIRQTARRNLLLDIKAGEMRYWVRR